MEQDSQTLLQLVESPEDFVDHWVAAPSLPPPFNNPLIVAEEVEVPNVWEVPCDHVAEQLKGNSLSPSDSIPAACLPAWIQSPLKLVLP